MEVPQVNENVTTLWSLFPGGSPTSTSFTIPSSLENTRSRKFGVWCNLCLVGCLTSCVKNTSLVHSRNLSAELRAPVPATGSSSPQLKGHCIEFKYYADGIHSGLTPPG